MNGGQLYGYPIARRPVVAALLFERRQRIDVRLVRAVGVGARARAFAQHVERIGHTRIGPAFDARHCIRQVRREDKLIAEAADAVDHQRTQRTFRQPCAQRGPIGYRIPQFGVGCGVAGDLQRGGEHARDEVAVQADARAAKVS